MKTLNKSLTDISLVEISEYGHTEKSGFFHKMVKRNPTKYNIREGGKWVTLTYTKKHKLDTSYYNVHVAFRKACDSTSASIIWNCMSVLAGNHRELLMDTMENSLPKFLDKDNEHECEGFNSDFIAMWRNFSRRLMGYILVENEKEANYPYTSDVLDSIKKYSDLYQVTMANLNCAIEIENKDGGYSGFPYFMYYAKDEQ